MEAKSRMCFSGPSRAASNVDEDKGRFEEKLGKIARAKPKEK